MEDVDGALGCALVDLGTGLPLAMEVTSPALLETGALEVLSAAGAEYFRGAVNRQLASAMGGDPGADGFVEEIQTTTDDSYHFMCMVPGNRQTVLLLVTDKTANLGLGWVAMRRTLRRVQESTARATRGTADGRAAVVAPVGEGPPDGRAPVVAPVGEAPPAGTTNGSAGRWRGGRSR